MLDVIIDAEQCCSYSGLDCEIDHTRTTDIFDAFIIGGVLVKIKTTDTIHYEDLTRWIPEGMELYALPHDNDFIVIGYPIVFQAHEFDVIT